jgi:kelch-like protein 2/3
MFKKIKKLSILYKLAGCSFARFHGHKNSKKNFKKNFQKNNPILYIYIKMFYREWRTIANMSTRRSSVGVGVLGGLIYAVGGYDGNSRQCLSSVEVYRPDHDVWNRVSDMSARRSGAGVGVLNGLLYSVGGHDGPLVRKSVECYSSDRDEWTCVGEMNFCRRNAGVITHNGLLYVVGGDDGSSNLQSVECYNPKTDVWTVLPAMMGLGRSYTGVCVIDKPEGI